MEAACYASKYLAHPENLGSYFTNCCSSILSSFLHFLTASSSILSMLDANWVSQDATQSLLPSELPLFVSRSMSAFYIGLYGPIHWLSICQSVTAGSSTEAEIYATNEYILLELYQIFEFLNLKDIFLPGTNVVCNDNYACVQWSKSSTTKGLRHIQMRENLSKGKHCFIF